MDRERITKLVGEVGHHLKERYGVTFIILFGSLAPENSSKTRTPMSDIDLAVYVSTAIHSRHSSKAGGGKNGRYFDISLSLIGEFTRILGTDSVDVTIINEAPPVLKYEIFAKGRLLYCEDEVEYENQYLMGLKEYFDIQPLLDKWFEEARRYLSTTH